MDAFGYLPASSVLAREKYILVPSHKRLGRFERYEELKLTAQPEIEP
jgi:hypothetical protein